MPQRTLQKIIPLIVLLFASCETLKTVDRSAFTMGSIVHFQAKSKNIEAANHFINQQLALFQHYDDLWSLYKTESLLCRINRNAGRRATPIDVETYKLLKIAVEAYKETEKQFNVAILPLLRSYHFYSNDESEKKTIQRDSLLSKVNFEKVHFTSKTIHLEKGMALSFDGLAVGYVLNQIKLNFEKEEAIRSLFVNHSGDMIYLNKDLRDSIPIELGFSTPSNDYLLYLKANYALAASGNYENLRMFKGREVGHILNPINGAVIERKQSSIVIGRNSIWTDIWSTVRVIDHSDGKLIHFLD